MKRTLIKNGLIVTMDDQRRVIRGDLCLQDDKITQIAKKISAKAGDRIVDAHDRIVIPGLIQAHVHLVQTLFRGYADDLELLDWLKKKIWPMENAHTKKSIRASADLGLMEMQLTGTTSILDMGTVRHHEEVFAAAEASGMRYWGGPCLMDLKGSSGPLYTPMETSLSYCRKLIQDWHLKTPLLQFAISPRFAISCSDKMLQAAADLQREFGILMHTHASENKTEVALVKKRTGLANITFLKKMGLLTEKSVIAHGIHLSKTEIQQLQAARAGIAHCPSSNLKLASGIAKITEYRKKKIKVALGADGAPCNNTLDLFIEMRLAALLQKPLFGPTALPAHEALELATLGGAKVLNAENQIGSLEVGKQADVVLVYARSLQNFSVKNPYSALVYSTSGRDVTDVWIAGRPVVKNRKHLRFSSNAVKTRAKKELDHILGRID